jgi:hypothetical protein
MRKNIENSKIKKEIENRKLNTKRQQDYQSYTDLMSDIQEVLPFGSHYVNISGHVCSICRIERLGDSRKTI